MLKVSSAALILGFAFLLPLLSVLQAQASAAPIPVQVLTARKVFISNIGNDHNFTGNDHNLSIWSGGSDRLYNTFYAAIKSCGRYELVAAPADSDLVMEVMVLPSDGTWYPKFRIWQFKLVLLDPKTQIILWTHYEPIKVTYSEKTNDANFDETINKLVDDLKSLTIQPAATAK